MLVRPQRTKEAATDAFPWLQLCFTSAPPYIGTTTHRKDSSHQPKVGRKQHRRKIQKRKQQCTHSALILGVVTLRDSGDLRHLATRRLLEPENPSEEFIQRHPSPCPAWKTQGTIRVVLAKDHVVALRPCHQLSGRNLGETKCSGSFVQASCHVLSLCAFTVQSFDRTRTSGRFAKQRPESWAHEKGGITVDGFKNIMSPPFALTRGFS
ncbi:hypothetical protein MUK42_35123 [Musa troglodytarum]|uniref:Uncharacterized protein n=1 Tax=Musa troglodytarum TaxID=320322 RepID=A0A9E7JTJ1_9LILI|nr:hypothetical protein MUK42_35123 [Musa troglodytarum]